MVRPAGHPAFAENWPALMAALSARTRRTAGNLLVAWQRDADGWPVPVGCVQGGQPVALPDDSVETVLDLLALLAPAGKTCGRLVLIGRAFA